MARRYLTGRGRRRRWYAPRVTVAEGAILAGASFLAGVINVAAGGGSLLTAPLLLLIGLGEHDALGTNRAAMTALSVAGLVRYQRAGLVRWRVAAGPALLAAGGALIGAYLMLLAEPRLLRWIVGGVMLALVPIVILRPERRLRPRAAGRATPAARLARALLWLCLGVYGGFYGAGVSTLFIVALVLGYSLDYVTAAATTQVIAGSLSLVAAIALALEGAVRAGPAAVMIVALAAGGLVGADIAVRVGERWVRSLLVVVTIGLAIRLLI